MTNENQYEFKCPKGRVATYVCVSQKCDHNAFCCKQSACCQKIMKPKCKLMKVQDLMKVHQTSCTRLDSIYNSTLEFYESVMKMIQNEIKNFKQWSEKSFAIRRIFKKTDHTLLTAEDLSKILEDINEYNEQYYQGILAYLKQWDKNFIEQFGEIRLILCEKSRKRLGSQSRSMTKNVNEEISKNFSSVTRIVWKQNQKQALTQVFKSLKANVLSINLLFHASSHQFSVSKFHELCDGIPNTLVIIKNDKEKVYGGFTPMPWGKSKFQKYIPDDTLKTFVFTLTHKKRYLLRQRQKNYAIEWNSLFGPLFGRCNIIQVWDKANKQSTYWQHLPFTFKPLHGEWTNQMYEEMLGVTKYEYFKLLDWEVLQVIFE